ncbi:MAG TPA: phytoene/squalene synthase family protein [Acidobacteriaceae bacterium]|nr:phytoene/squalene synthase family protein [Acidobacteriaceae bacterium]
MMPAPSRTVLLGSLLRSVSRSFYLTLRVLPAGMREPVGLAYLLARAADTIVDTSLLLPELRREFLLGFRASVNGSGDEALLDRIAVEAGAQQRDSDEKTLLESLRPALALLSQLNTADRDAVREVVTTLTQGMEFDLRIFPPESSGQLAALDEYSDLDSYTYFVAGCVGEFWTRMTWAHAPGSLAGEPEAMLERGVRFGKALQLTNILRDCGKDLRIGRCYLPSSILARYGLTPNDLLRPENSQRTRPLLFELVRRDLDHYRAAMDYTLALRPSSRRLRLACLWPVLIGLETMALLVRNEAWLDPAKASKIRRSDVYKIVARSLVLASSNRRLKLWMDSLIAKVEEGMQS